MATVTITGVERVEPHRDKLTTILNVAMTDDSEIPPVFAEVVESLPLDDSSDVRSVRVARDKDGELLPQLEISTDVNDLAAAARAVSWLWHDRWDAIAAEVKQLRQQAKWAKEQVASVL